MAGDQEAVASGKCPRAVFRLPLQNHRACSALCPGRLISRDCGNRLSCLWVCWDSVSGRHQKATTGWQSQAQSLNPPGPLCWAAWSSLHFPSIGLSSYQEPSLPACPLPLRDKTRDYWLGVLCLPLWVSLNSLGTLIKSLFVKLSATPFECTVWLLRGSSVIRILCQFCTVVDLGQFCLWLPIPF